MFGGFYFAVLLWGVGYICCYVHFSLNRSSEMFEQKIFSLHIPRNLRNFKTTRKKRKKKHLNTSVINFVSHFCFHGIDSLCAVAMAHPSVTTSTVSSRQWNDLEIIGTKSLPACHGMRSVLYIHMYWTQTCHRLWQPHSSHTKPILSAAQCALSVPPPSRFLSDSIEMNIRAPGYVFKWFVFPPPTEANFQRLINLGTVSSQRTDVLSLTETLWGPMGGCHGCWQICYFKSKRFLPDKCWAFCINI